MSAFRPCSETVASSTQCLSSQSSHCWSQPHLSAWKPTSILTLSAFSTAVRGGVVFLSWLHLLHPNNGLFCLPRSTLWDFEHDKHCTFRDMSINLSHLEQPIVVDCLHVGCKKKPTFFAFRTRLPVKLWSSTICDGHCFRSPALGSYGCCSTCIGDNTHNSQVCGVINNDGSDAVDWTSLKQQ